MRQSLKFLILLLALVVTKAQAQETVFNVPNADILDRGQVYVEFDFAYRQFDDVKGYTPRAVVGIGHRIEIGVNINNVVQSGPSQATITPTMKWKIYSGKENGWAFLVGDNLFIPVQNRTYKAGVWTYAEFAKTLRTKTRLTAGGYFFSRNVVASTNRGGGQFAIEQPVESRVTLAADWFTGNQSFGYVTPGVVIKLNNNWTWYIGYQIGNAGVMNGNHQLLTEVGWNVNAK